MSTVRSKLHIFLRLHLHSTGNEDILSTQEEFTIQFQRISPSKIISWIPPLVPSPVFQLSHEVHTPAFILQLFHKLAMICWSIRALYYYQLLVSNCQHINFVGGWLQLAAIFERNLSRIPFLPTLLPEAVVIHFSGLSNAHNLPSTVLCVSFLLRNSYTNSWKVFTNSAQRNEESKKVFSNKLIYSQLAYIICFNIKNRARERARERVSAKNPYFSFLYRRFAKNLCVYVDKVIISINDSKIQFQSGWQPPCQCIANRSFRTNTPSSYFRCDSWKRVQRLCEQLSLSSLLLTSMALFLCKWGVAVRFAVPLHGNFRYDLFRCLVKVHQ